MFRLLALLVTSLPLTLLAAGAASARESAVERGEYLVNLLGCGRCHTEGYLLGIDATAPPLAGSRVGIAYTEGDQETTPGLVFPPNLTPDDETGIGRWSARDIIRTLTTGVGTDGHQRLPVMPWPNYGALHRQDLEAIAAYLKSLEPVARSIPETTVPGAPAEHPYVRFGIFVFTPLEEREPERPPEASSSRL